MALKNFKCNYLTPLHFKGLNKSMCFSLRTVLCVFPVTCQCLSLLVHVLVGSLLH